MTLSISKISIEFLGQGLKKLILLSVKDSFFLRLF